MATNKRILVVDDEIDYLRLLKLALEHEGDYSVHTVHTVTAVLQEARDFMPDLILLDCMMPVMHGNEVAGQLQADPCLKHVPFLFLTCTVSKVALVADSGDECVHTYVPKLIGLRALVELVEAKLRGADDGVRLIA